MIARIWRGRVRHDRAEEYLQLMRDVAIRDYRATAGNLGAWCAERAVEITMLTLWLSIRAVEAFAGPVVDRAKYYDFDDQFLLEKPEHVEHYEVFGDPSAEALTTVPL
jgi:hypothetical protein